ncbi:TGF-beta-activated kinase 1 and MAP3K7-binding protein 2 [Aphis craccivora]|uniref:TGF-beta-activated kinase 1 and MAP3K7-binding protein 2 n=1 Tax=Aphis craccivora TaxID=307492 RepID=A0A6G0YD17_APHCR|nr:TGF-beta-activated kinase 1 and MAP3K7-binding protein 2 [Aphis craccivora]
MLIEHSENQNWVCPMYTFQNHPILPRCEQCDMARFDLGTTTSVMNNNIPMVHFPSCAKEGIELS